MRRNGLYVVVLLAGVTVAASCAKQQETIDPKLNQYLLDQYDWEVRVERAVCKLEGQASGLKPEEMLCPDPNSPPDKTSPPAYPPK